MTHNAIAVFFRQSGGKYCVSKLIFTAPTRKPGVHWVENEIHCFIRIFGEDICNFFHYKKLKWWYNSTQ